MPRYNMVVKDIDSDTTEILDETEVAYSVSTPEEIGMCLANKIRLAVPGDAFDVTVEVTA